MKLLVLFLAITIRTYGENVKKNDEGYFWQITDIHYDSNYSTSLSDVLDVCHGRAGGSFGDYRCDSPWKLVQSAITAMSNLKPSVDFILWTGDNAPHVPDKNINPTKVYTTIGNVTDLLRKVFPKTQIFPTIGNHDEWPANDVPIKTDQYFNCVLANSGWENLLKEESINTFRKGGYYVEDYGPWRIFGLNTILWYQANMLIKNATDPGEQMLWLDKELDKAKKAKKKVLLSGHVPPGYSFSHINSQWYLERFGQQFHKMLQDFHQNIEAGIFGHEHTDSFRIAYGDSGEPIVPIFLSPSVTPWNASWGNIGGPNNPSIRLYKFNNKTGQILDYTQYFLNLTKANTNDDIDWEIEYNFQQDFQQKNANATSLHKVLTEFKTANSTQFVNYYKYFYVSYNTSQVCDEKCKLGHICGISCIVTSEYKKCINQTMVDSIQSHHHKIKPMPIHPVRSIPKYVYYLIGGLVFFAVFIFIVVAIFCCRSRVVYGTRLHQGYVRVGVNS